ncbi:MAG: hypothetical protein ACPLX8_02440, partial [Nanopusillaceae archaeon]
MYPPVYSVKKNVSLKKGYNRIEIDNINVANYMPNAYSLRIELVKDGQIQSIYRSRFIVLGPTVRLGGVFLQGNGNLTVIVSPSPDHFTYPVTENVSLKIFSNVLGYSEEIYLGNIGWNLTQFTYVNKRLPINSTEFDLCLTLFYHPEGPFYNLIGTEYCTYYRLDKSNTYGIPLEDLIYVNYSNNYFYICSNVSGILNIGYNSESNVIYTAKIENGCLNYTFSDSGKYYIYFSSNEYSNSWAINYSNLVQSSENISTNQTAQGASSISSNKGIFTIIVILLIISAVLYIMMKKMKKGKFLLLPLLLIPALFSIHSQDVSLSTNSICIPYDSLNITTANFTGTVYVNFTFYNLSNTSQIFAKGSYSYNGSSITRYSYNV